MRVARMGYITTQKGIKWVRIVVPDDLVPVLGKKNLMESLETKDNRMAVRRSPAVIAKFQTADRRFSRKARGVMCTSLRDRMQRSLLV